MSTHAPGKLFEPHSTVLFNRSATRQSQHVANVYESTTGGEVMYVDAEGSGVRHPIREGEEFVLRFFKNRIAAIVREAS